jgi:succinate-acetate transporter protein
MGWVEDEFQELVIGYAIFYGGLCQLLVAILELFKGSTFPFAVFGSYGAFWLGWGLVHLENKKTDIVFTNDYQDGKTAFLIQWGFLTFCFWIVALRKNICLITVLGLLSLTFFLLAAENHSGSENAKKAAGAFGFLTGLAAWYTALAEIINEEWGHHILPGLKPLISRERFLITKESIGKCTSYDSKTNTMFIQLRGIQINKLADVENMKHGLEAVFQATGQAKVHVVVDYEDVVISDDVFQAYWEMVKDLEREYYLSAKRFHISSFGTRHAGANANNMAARSPFLPAENWTAQTNAVEKPLSGRNLDV